MKQIKLKQKWLLYGSIVASICISNNSFGQSVKRQCVSSYGAVGTTDNVSISQTAGQSYHTMSTSENKTAVLQGFQQPKTFAVEDISNNDLKNLNLLVYPNPASYSVNIRSEEEIIHAFIQVVDINGKYVFSEKVSNLQVHTLNCESWVNGIYFITITDSAKNFKSLKLIISK